MLSKELKLLSILRRQGTPMRAHLQLPEPSQRRPPRHPRSSIIPWLWNRACTFSNQAAQPHAFRFTNRPSARGPPHRSVQPFPAMLLSRAAFCCRRAWIRRLRRRRRPDEVQREVRPEEVRSVLNSSRFICLRDICYSGCVCLFVCLFVCLVVYMCSIVIVSGHDLSVFPDPGDVNSCMHKYPETNIFTMV